MKKGEIPKIKLYNGNEMPQLGFGVYLIKGDELTEKCVLEALKAGYRHIDTAHLYENERGVGSAIKKSGIPRNEIWVTSKIWITEFGGGETTKAIDKMLNRLGLDYIDLVLVHYPMNNYLDAYKELEIAYEKGKIKNIGISNFEDENFDELCKNVKIKPVVNQIELHPYFQQKEIRKKMEKVDCKVEGWGPLAHGSSNLLKEEIITNMAKKYKKTSAQIVLRWHIQNGFITIPKSSKPERIKENIDIFDFELTEDEMKEINNLDGKKGRIQYNYYILKVAFWFWGKPKD